MSEHGSLGTLEQTQGAPRRDPAGEFHPGGGIPIQCQFCVGQKFRRSRIRMGDIKHLLLMRYPVRCLRCSQRQMVSFTVAGISIPSHVRHQRQRRSTSGSQQH